MNTFITFIDKAGALIWQESATEARLAKITAPGYVIDEQWFVHTVSYDNGVYWITVVEVTT